MLLVQEGKVKLDDPVTVHIPDFKLSDPAATLDVAAMQQAADFVRPHVMDVLKGLQPTFHLSFGGGAPAGSINANAAEMARYLRFQLQEG